MTMMSAGQAQASNAPGSALGSYPSLGMAMRFAVQVDDLGSSPTLPATGTSLGLWMSCKNLQVELQYKKFAQGGDSLVDQWLPEKLVYSPVTLERPMESASSGLVRKWLQKYIADWNTYPTKPGGAPPSTYVTITLLDYQLNQVMTWRLNQARPSKWMGPSLAATDNKVAIETLVIDHSGFL